MSSANQSLPIISPFWRLCAFCAGTLLSVGVMLPFFPVWLAARGLASEQIGLVLALPTLVRIPLNPPIGHLADRYNASAHILAVTALGIALCYAGLSLVDGFLPIAFMVALIGCLQAPMIPLSDALILSHVQRFNQLSQQTGGGRKLTYGKIRGVGSAFILLSMLGGGYLVERLPSEDIIWILSWMALAAAVAAFFMLRHEREIAAFDQKSLEGDETPMVAAPAGVIALIILGSSLIQSSHGLLYGFASLNWQRAGYSDSFIAFAWGMGVCSEALFFFSAGVLPVRRQTGFALLIGGGCAAIMRWVLAFWAQGPIEILALQCMHALTFGATHLGTIMLQDLLVLRTQRARIQSWQASAMALMLSLTTAASGWLYARWQGDSVIVMAFIGLLGVLPVLVAFSRLRKA